MAYLVVLDPVAQEDVEALPRWARPAVTEALVVLEEVPWNGRLVNEANPDGAVRQFLFGPEGAGTLTYLIVEDDRRVDVLTVSWAAG